MQALEPITTMVLVSLLVAYILDPPVSRLESLGVPRYVSAFCIIVSVFLFATLLILGLMPAIVREVSDFAKIAPRYLAELRESVMALAEKLDIHIPRDWEELSPLLLERLRAAWPSLAESFGKVASSAFKSAINFVSASLQVAMVPIIAYYVLVEFEDFRRGVTGLIPPYAREPLMNKLREIDQVLSAFIRGQLTIAAILAVLYSVGFLIIGIDLALVLGILSGILWIIPYLGTLFGLVAGSAMALAKFGDLIHVLYIVGWIALVQLLEAYVLTPKIVGKAVGLNPVVYILALFVGANLLGFIGLLIAIPVTAVLMVLLRSVVSAYRDSYLYKDESPDNGEVPTDRTPRS
jgi:predicted PurR-regulated permease PerM